MNFQKSQFKLMLYFFIIIIILFGLAYYIKGYLEIEKLNTIQTNKKHEYYKLSDIKQIER